MYNSARHVFSTSNTLILTLLIILLLNTGIFYVATSYTSEPDVTLLISYDGKKPYITVYEGQTVKCKAEFNSWAYSTLTEEFAFVNLYSFINPDTGEPCVLNAIRGVVWEKGTVLFKLDDTTSQTYRLALGLERFSINRDDNSVLVSFRDVKPVYMLSSFDALSWKEPIILYSPDVFKRESFEGIDIIYDTRVDPDVLEVVSEGLSLVNTLRDAYGETIFDPTIFVLTSNDVPDPYGHYNGAHNFGSVSYMKEGNRYLYEDAVITIHELAHSWFSAPYTSPNPYTLLEGGAEFTSWDFGMKYFPEETRSYVERDWICNMAKGEDPYMFGATALLVINYYIMQLSSLKNENLTVVDAVRYVIENINGLPEGYTRSPWSEVEKQFYTTFWSSYLISFPFF